MNLPTYDELYEMDETKVQSIQDCANIRFNELYLMHFKAKGMEDCIEDFQEDIIAKLEDLIFNCENIIMNRDQEEADEQQYRDDASSASVSGRI